MSEFINKLKDILLGVDIEDEEDELEEEYEETTVDRRERTRPEVTNFDRTARPSSLIKHPSASNNVVDLYKKTQVNVCSPTNIEEARTVIDNTKAQIISIVNLDGIDNANSQRIADFLSGSVDALDGTIRRLSDEMFIIGPYGVNISSSLSEEITEDLKSSGISLSWANSVFK